jgi:hypothetical protein
MAYGPRSCGAEARKGEEVDAWFDEDRPANYPSEEFVFRRCSG